MTRVDFYVLQSNDTPSLQIFVCRLIEKAVAQGHRVMLITKNIEETHTFDRQLWEFKPESYIPHQKLNDNVAIDEVNLSHDIPVIISHEFDNAHYHDLLINLQLDIAKQFSRFERVAEIVNQNNPVLAASRKNYSFYKERGYPIFTHKLNF